MSVQVIMMSSLLVYKQLSDVRLVRVILSWAFCNSWSMIAPPDQSFFLVAPGSSRERLMQHRRVRFIGVVTHALINDAHIYDPHIIRLMNAVCAIF